MEMIKEKERKEAEKVAKRELRMLQKVEKDAEKELHWLGIQCRKGERIRKQELNKLLPGDIGWAHLQWPLPDIEKEILRQRSIGSVMIRS
jgi:hypothetical protein